MNEARAKNQRGLMLLETLVVITIVAILAAIAIPNINTLLTRKDIENTRENIAHTLKIARQMAQAENTIVDVKIADGKLSMTPRNNSASKSIDVSARVKITSETLSDNVQLVFRPVGTVGRVKDEQVIDLASDVLIQVSASDENMDIEETLVIGSYGNIAGL